jgi:hypothetical protein
VLAGLEETWSLPDDLLSRVTGHLLETRIDVLDGAFHIGDQDRVGGLLHGSGQSLGVLEGPLLGGDVTEDHHAAGHGAVVAPPGSRARADPDAGIHVLVPNKDLDVRHYLPAKRPGERQLIGGERCHGVREIAAVDPCPVIRAHGERTQTEDPLRSRVETQDSPVPIGEHEPIGKVLDHGLQECFGVREARGHQS